VCSIFGILDIKDAAGPMRAVALRQSRLLRHRGPDWSGSYTHDHAVLAHERLAIVDVNTGAQPLRSADGACALAVNGEIYNHAELRRGALADYPFTTASDCEVILPLYQERGTDFLNELRGMFAFVLFDAEHDHWLIARDPVGIIPLYTGYDEAGRLYVASEMKALMDVCIQVEEFPPGHYWQKGDEAPVRYFEPTWANFDALERKPTDRQALFDALDDSVRSHLMSDVPYGVLLSGGLDSSLIAALAARHAERRVEDDEQSRAWWPRLHSFAVGLEGSPDLAAAEAVADAIGTVHHGMTYTIQEGLDALEEVIWHLETYDVTTIRAATPMYLMARKIRAMGIKMVLSGEGADEVFGGYLYFHKAPDARAFHEETVRKVSRLHQFDCLRANKAMSAWGVEARVPFLDRDFLNFAMSLDPADKMVPEGGMEKQVLREALGHLLPESVAWRQKEQFSDGVGYGWIDALRDHAEKQVSDQALENAARRFPHNTPDTKEAYHYRTIFERLFPLPSATLCVPGGKSVACSSPEAMAWDPAFAELADPSGRAMRTVHKDAY
jgi:asparagine synthase (glutamine-hydrolysing)